MLVECRLNLRREHRSWSILWKRMTKKKEDFVSISEYTFLNDIQVARECRNVYKFSSYENMRSGTDGHHTQDEECSEGKKLKDYFYRKFALISNFFSSPQYWESAGEKSLKPWALFDIIDRVWAFSFVPSICTFYELCLESTTIYCMFERHIYSEWKDQ